MNIENGNEKV